MKMKKIQLHFTESVLLIALFVSVFNFNAQAQLTTTRAGNYAKINYLVNNVLLGSGVIATNITYQGIDTSFGFFNGKTSNIGMDSGLIMTNGTITLADGPNSKASDKSDGKYTTYNYSTTDGWPASNTYRDTDLANLIGTTYANTYSCALLQFDFVATSDSIEFQYVFASNEEPYYVGSKYLDDFGFFLSGPGIAGPFSRGAINLALIPKTTTAVYINSVNCTTNSAYYVCNWPASTGCSTCPATLATTTVGYNGFTTVLTAKAYVQCGKKYHIKLGLADIGNGKFDSGVLLKGGSFKPTTNPLVASPTSSNICSGNSVTLTASGATGYTWSPAASLNTTTGASVIATPTVTTTYTVIGNIVGACDDTAKLVVTVNPTPTVTVNAAPSSTICSGGSTTLTAGGATTYTWSPATALNKTTGTSVVASPTVTTTYTVTGTSAGGCINTNSIVVTVTTTPTVSIAITGISPSLCAGDTIGLVASGATSYTWSPAASLNSSTGSYVIANPGVTTTYTVIGTLAGGCTGRDSIKITVNPTPTVTLSTTSSPNLCSGTSDTIKATGASTYTWSPAASLSSSTGTPVVTTPSTTTTYTVVGKNASGCTDTAKITISVTPTPTVSITPTSPGICPGDTALLTASGATTYVWSPGTGLNITTGASVLANPASSITYTITGTNGACTSKDSVSINVGKLVVTASASSSTICSGSSTSLTAAGALNYTWKPITGLSSSTGSPVTATPSVTTTYSVTGTSGSGCSDSATITITVNPTPTLSVSAGNPLICFGASGTTIIASGANTYTWSPISGLSCSTCTNPNANPGSTTTYTVTGTSAAGCGATDTVSIQVDKPSITAGSSSSSICNGTTTSLDASGGTSYVWSPAASLSATSGAIVTGNPATSTTYTVVGTDAAGCKDSANIAITVNPLPSVSASASNTSICSGSSTSLNASGATTYSWTPSGSLTCATCPSTSANPGSSTTYTVVGTSAAGCNDTTQISITVNPIPTISISLSGNDTLCPGQSVNMTANGGVSYTWSPSTGLSSTTGTTVTATLPSSPMVYKVVGSNGSCADSASQTIYLYPPLNVIMPPDTICLGKSGQVEVIVTGGKPGYNYIWNNGLPNNAGPFTISPVLSTYYTCSVTDGCGTTIKDSELVFSAPIPIASFIDNPNTIWGGQYVSFTNSSTGATSYYWNFGDGGSSTNTTPYYQYNVPGTYIVYLIASNRYGCSDSITDTVFVEGGLYVPNVFTPNGDGQNDVFHITAGGMKTYDLEIFNRWGQKVFETDSPNIDWSGKSMAGIDQSDGIYYYIIKATDYNNKKYNLDGYLQLIR